MFGGVMNPTTSKIRIMEVRRFIVVGLDSFKPKVNRSDRYLSLKTLGAPVGMDRAKAPSMLLAAEKHQGLQHGHYFRALILSK